MLHAAVCDNLHLYANNEPKSALARDLGDCRDNKGKLAKRVSPCQDKNLPLPRPADDRRLAGGCGEIKLCSYFFQCFGGFPEFFRLIRVQ